MLQEQSHLCLYLLVQVRCEIMGQHTRAVLYLPRTHRLLRWGKAVTIPTTSHLDQIQTLYLTHGLKSPNIIDPKHPLIDLQEEDPFYDKEEVPKIFLWGSHGYSKHFVFSPNELFGTGAEDLILEGA